MTDQAQQAEHAVRLWLVAVHAAGFELRNASSALERSAAARALEICERHDELGLIAAMSRSAIDLWRSEEDFGDEQMVGILLAQLRSCEALSRAGAHEAALDVADELREQARSASDRELDITWIVSEVVEIMRSVLAALGDAPDEISWRADPAAAARHSWLRARALDIAQQSREAETTLRRAISSAQARDFPPTGLWGRLARIVQAAGRPHEARIYFEREAREFRDLDLLEAAEMSEAMIRLLDENRDTDATRRRNSVLAAIAHLDPDEENVASRLTTAIEEFGLVDLLEPLAIDLAAFHDDADLASLLPDVIGVRRVLHGELDAADSSKAAKQALDAALGVTIQVEADVADILKEQHEQLSRLITEPVEDYDFDLGLEHAVEHDDRMPMHMGRSSIWMQRGVHILRSRPEGSAGTSELERAVWYLELARAALLDEEALSSLPAVDLRLSQTLLDAGDATGAFRMALSAVADVQQTRRLVHSHTTRNAWAASMFVASQNLVSVAGRVGTPGAVFDAVTAIDAVQQDALAALIETGLDGQSNEAHALLKRLRAVESELLATPAERQGKARSSIESIEAEHRRTTGLLLEKLGDGTGAVQRGCNDLATPAGAWRLWISTDDQELIGAWCRAGGEWRAFRARLDVDVKRLWSTDGAAAIPLDLKSSSAANALLSGVADALPDELLSGLDKQEGARLRIVACGALAAIPWAALPLPSGRPLLATTTCVLAPSFGASDSIDRRPAPTGAVAAHSALTALDADLRAIDPDALSRSDEFLGRLKRPTRLVVCAAHGFNTDGLAHRVSLRDDYPLTAGALLEAKLTGSLWLASCFAARPEWRTGVEGWGLATAALASGACAAVGAIWPVPTEDVVALTRRALPDLLAGIDAVSALRNAQWWYVGEHPGAAPWRWATMAAIGA